MSFGGIHDEEGLPLELLVQLLNQLPWHCLVSDAYGNGTGCPITPNRATKGKTLSGLRSDRMLDQHMPCKCGHRGKASDGIMNMYIYILLIMIMKKHIYMKHPPRYIRGGVGCPHFVEKTVWGLQNH